MSDERPLSTILSSEEELDTQALVRILSVRSPVSNVGTKVLRVTEDDYLKMIGKQRHYELKLNTTCLFAEILPWAMAYVLTKLDLPSHLLG